MSTAPIGIGGLFDNIVGAVTSIASGGDPVSAAASLVPAVSLSIGGQSAPGPKQTWKRWQQIHPGTPRSDYDNWWSQYGQSGGTIDGAGQDAGVGQAALAIEAATKHSSAPPVGGVHRVTQGAKFLPSPALNTWQRWQQIHPGTPHSDYVNWWVKYGVKGGTIDGAGVGQDALQDALNMANSRDYTVSRGDSPTSIAKKFGVSLDQLLNANPQKATTVVKGVRTWTDLSINEGLNLPKAGVRLGYVAGTVGDYATDTVRAVSGFDPCARENVRRVCAAQAAMGFRPDGKWGEDTYIAALGFNPQAPPPCQPRPAWWPPAGYGACAPTPNQVLVDAKKALAELKRLREGSGAMSGIRLNGAPIAGLGLGQDPAAPPAAAPPVVPDPVAQAQAAGAAADASGKAAMAARHTWAGWWHHLSTPAKIGVAAVPVVAVGTGVYLATHKKKGRGKRRSRR